MSRRKDITCVASSTPMTDLLSIQGLRVRFRTVGFVRALVDRVADPFIDAVLDVSLKVRQGETLGLVGESGSGKTTLARAVLGLVPVHSGSISVAGRELVGLGESAYRSVRRELGMMFQDPVASLSPRKSVRGLLVEPFHIHGIKDVDTEKEARRLLSIVGLHEGFLGAYAHQLSGGQARRVGVARTLALKPKMILADEPTAGLDVSVQGEILNLMNELQQQFGLSYLIVTHNLPVIRHVSDRLAIMYLGRLVEQGSTRSIFAKPAHPYTQALLAAVPQPDPDKRRDHLELQGEIPSLRRRPSGCEFHTRCVHAQARCRVEAPGPTSLGDGREVRCHFPLI